MFIVQIDLLENIETDTFCLLKLPSSDWFRLDHYKTTIILNEQSILPIDTKQKISLVITNTSIKVLYFNSHFIYTCVCK